MEHPSELYADIISYTLAKGKKSLEIGAGTGKATAPFLTAGYEVTAIELSANMAEFIRKKFHAYDNFNVIVSEFEKVALLENDYDLIFAASAFHWVDAAIGCPKVYSLLKPDGTFALFRNNAIPEDGNKLYEEIQVEYEKYYYKHYRTDQRPLRLMDMSNEEFSTPAMVHRGFRFKRMEDYGFENITMKLYKSSQTYTANEYIALLDTYSDHRALPEGDKAALYVGIKNAILRHGGQHRLNCIFQLYMGRKP